MLWPCVCNGTAFPLGLNSMHALSRPSTLEWPIPIQEYLNGRHRLQPSSIEWECLEFSIADRYHVHIPGSNSYFRLSAST